MRSGGGTMGGDGGAWDGGARGAGDRRRGVGLRCAPGAGFVASEAVFTLAEEDFVHPAHRAVFRALKTLIEAQVEVNSLTLKDALDQDDSLNKVGGYPGLVE